MTPTSPPSRALPLALLVLAAVAIGAAYAWPLPLALGARVPDTPFTDGHRIAMGFGAGTLGPLTLPIAGGADFRPLLWPADLLAAIAGPARTLDLVFLLTPAFNAVCGWILGGALGLGPWSRFVLGAAIAWNPWVHTTLANGQLEQAVIGGAALIWASAIATVKRTSRWWLGLPFVPVVTLAVGAAAPHVALAASVGLLGWALPAVVRDRSTLPRWLATLGAVALGAWLAGRYHAPSFDATVRLFAPFGSVDAAPVGGQVKRAVLLGDLLRAPAAPPRLANGVIHSGDLGVALVVAALGGLYWRRGGLIAGSLCLVLAFGAGGRVPLPYAALEALSPTIAASGTPYRFLIGAIVGLAASAAAIPWGPRGALALTALLWAEGWTGDPRPLPLTTRAVEYDPSSAALAQGEGPVLDLPVVGPRCKEGAAHYLLEATVHHRPVPVVLRPGYEAWPAAGSPWDRALARTLDTGLLHCDPAAVAAIRTAGFRAVVAHGHRNCNLEPAEVACLRTAFGAGQSAGKVTWWELPPAE